MWLMLIDEFYMSFTIGYVVIAIPFVVMVVNIYYIIYETYHEFQRMKLLKLERKTMIMLKALKEDYKTRIIAERIKVKILDKAKRLAGLKEEFKEKEQ